MSQTPSEKANPKRSGRDRWVKIGFAVVALLVIMFIYYRQTGRLKLDWPEDLAAARQQARKEKRFVLVLFTGSTPSATARRLVETTLAKNRKAVQEGNFIRVLVGGSGDLTKRYGVATFPTMLVLAPNGWEYNRRKGFIGEVDFRNGFLDCAKIEDHGVVGWETDLEAALERAKTDKQAVLALFTGPLPEDRPRWDPDTRTLLETTLAAKENRQAILADEFILVHVSVSGPKDPRLTRRHGFKSKIKKLPTMLLLGPDGREKNRREGAIGERPFREEFLTCLKIDQP